MKIKLIIIAFIFSAIFSCNSNDTHNEEVQQEITHDTLSATASSDSAHTISSRPMIWTVDQENTGTEKLKKPEEKLDTFSSAHLIQLINNNFLDVQIELVKISNDTMYVKIPDSKKLTQEMGSTGAENYMASVTYTLTELKNIKFVNFAMKEGDHAGPGIFSRNDFKRLR
jgi:hypothetical protein